jgi:peroxiredoxin
MATRRTTQRIDPGAAVAARELVAISGERVRVPDGERLVHLQFRRFAGCPVCDLHLRAVARRHDDLAAAGIREVVVFHATAGELLPHAADLPFAVVADPDKRLYAAFGVESAPRALLDPRAWAPILRAVARSLWAVVRERRPPPAANPHGGRLGLPADFLIASDGRVLARKYGAHAYDQWSVDELLARARPARPGRQRRLRPSPRPQATKSMGPRPASLTPGRRAPQDGSGRAARVVGRGRERRALRDQPRGRGPVDRSVLARVSPHQAAVPGRRPAP